MYKLDIRIKRKESLKSSKNNKGKILPFDERGQFLSIFTLVLKTSVKITFVIMENFDCKNHTAVSQ
jgi:hypothetical protein